MNSSSEEEESRDVEDEEKSNGSEHAVGEMVASHPCERDLVPT
jgi:hypothetical protein